MFSILKKNDVQSIFLMIYWFVMYKYKYLKGWRNPIVLDIVCNLFVLIKDVTRMNIL
jgi:hypothetical protein